MKFNLAGIKEGKKVNITITGLTDFADNLVEPNPVTFTIQKGEKDGVAPEVKAITPVNAKKFVIEFSEEIQGLAVEDIKIGGNALSSPSAEVEVDKDDKTKYIVTVSNKLEDLKTISIAAETYQDLSGEEGKAASKIVDFGKDEKAPTLVGSSVSKDKNGKEVLTLEFSEDVTLKETGEVTFAATQVKDYVTTSETLKVQAANINAVDGDSTKFEITLEDFTSGVVENAEYTVDLPINLVEDTSDNGNKAKAKAFKFTRTSDTATEKPGIDKTLDSIDDFTGNEVQDNGILVVDNNTFKVKFTGNDLDNSTIINKANYNVQNATVEDVSYDGTDVTVTLAKDSNPVTGLRKVTISGIKTKAGIEMDAYSTREYFQENVRPTVTKSEVTKITEAVTSVDGSATKSGTNASKVTLSNQTDADATGTEVFTINSSGKVVNAAGDEETSLSGATGSYSGNYTYNGVSISIDNGSDNDTFTVSTVAKVTAADASTEVTLTFSEEVSKSGDEEDFALFIDDEKITADGVNVTTEVKDDTKELVLTIEKKALSGADFAKGVELRKTDDLAIKDSAGNLLNIEDPIKLTLSN